MLMFILFLFDSSKTMNDTHGERRWKKYVSISFFYFILFFVFSGGFYFISFAFADDCFRLVHICVECVRVCVCCLCYTFILLTVFSFVFSVIYDDFDVYDEFEYFLEFCFFSLFSLRVKHQKITRFNLSLGLSRLHTLSTKNLFSGIGLFLTRHFDTITVGIIGGSVLSFDWIFMFAAVFSFILTRTQSKQTVAYTWKILSPVHRKTG